jgi:two-component system alkaline phosphatase synthesis response regulator PhoP
MAAPRILIVDDERPLVSLLDYAFGSEGFEVANARDGIECMNKVASFRPDVILMDIMMPKLDGLDTTRLIRRNRSYAGTVIVALSAKTDSLTRRQMLDAGANLFVQKPFSIAKLVRRISQLTAARSEQP